MTAENRGLELCLLGPVRVRRDGAEVGLGSNQRTAIFSVLALNANHGVTRDQLVNAVWGDDPPAKAVGNVYTHISSLRQILEPNRERRTTGQLLVSEGGAYRLHVPASSVDVFRFESLRKEARGHRASGDYAAELAALEAAVGLWRDDALTDVPGPYAQAQRVRLAELRLASVVRHAALLIERGRPEDAVERLRPWTRSHRLQENLHATLMTALRAAGRRPEALAAYDEFATLLVEETGTEPSAMMRALREQVRVGPGAITLAGGLVRSVAPERTQLVGRKAELRLLRNAVADVTAGKGRSIWLKGTPGMGKSALLDAALWDADTAGVRIGWSSGDELIRRVPLGVLSECVESAICDDEGRERVRRRLADRPEADEGEATAPTVRAVEVVRELAARPLVLVIDDLQLADDATLRVWTELHTLTRELPLLLISASTPATDDRRLDNLRAVHLAEVILAGLTRDESATLVRLLSPAVPTPRELSCLVDDAGGNPYYLRHLALAAGMTYDDLAFGMPAPVIAAIDRHLASFGEETRIVLRALACLGDDCTIEEVAAVIGRPVEQLHRALAPAHAVGILTREGAQPRFRHRVVAQALHAGMPPALRMVLHRHVVDRIFGTGRTVDELTARLRRSQGAQNGWVDRWIDEHLERFARRDEALAGLLLERAEPRIGPDIRLRLTALAVQRACLFCAELDIPLDTKPNRLGDRAATDDCGRTASGNRAIRDHAGHPAAGREAQGRWCGCRTCTGYEPACQP
ncbi:BTAD domain-containing putative transcriptional regulator [Micromonospora sp. NPDC005367]|uniref:BTAD domain-containing putative transcriptional regulator n=1 Tax=Micromonospora sp. NPDC005367 TaxID=3155590 RepID=UPI0033B4A413